MEFKEGDGEESDQFTQSVHSRFFRTNIKWEEVIIRKVKFLDDG